MIILNKNGSPLFPRDAKVQIHEIFKLSQIRTFENIDVLAELYASGLSLNDIAKQTGKGRNTVRAALMKAGIAMRPRTSLPVHIAARKLGKQNIRPFFGFRYFQGEVVPDQQEYETLLLIHRLWKLGQNPNSIAESLNTKKVPARSAEKWSRNSIVLIINRFEERLITFKGAKYELR